MFCCGLRFHEPVNSSAKLRHTHVTDSVVVFWVHPRLSSARFVGAAVLYKRWRDTTGRLDPDHNPVAWRPHSAPAYGLHELTGLSSEPPRKPAPTSRRCRIEQCHSS